MPVAKLPGITPAEDRARLTRNRLCPSRRESWCASAERLLLGLCFGAAFGCLAQDSRPVPSADAKLQSADAAKSSLPKGDAPDSARKKQIADESSQLLAMALSLKAEVDKTNKDTLSLKVIRKADQIERLAKTVKEGAK